HVPLPPKTKTNAAARLPAPACRPIPIPVLAIPTNPTNHSNKPNIYIIIIITMRNSSIADRDPCPYRIIEDIGGAFAFGAIGGGIWHFGKGAWQSPRGSRLLGAIGNTAARAPVMGGQFAVWGGLFACCDCSLSALRQKMNNGVARRICECNSIIRIS
ncbi:hypothetical protein ACHAXH_005142, partial [Discostella pseudostelligera]